MPKKVQGGLCVKFGEFMARKGMSLGTTIKRFTDENGNPGGGSVGISL